MFDFMFFLKTTTALGFPLLLQIFYSSVYLQHLKISKYANFSVLKLVLEAIMILVY